jgi:hypothetical protein
MQHDVASGPQRGSDSHPLDTVIWQALTGAQASFAEGGGGARRYSAWSVRVSSPPTSQNRE